MILRSICQYYTGFYLILIHSKGGKTSWSKRNKWDNKERMS